MELCTQYSLNVLRISSTNAAPTQNYLFECVCCPIELMEEKAQNFACSIGAESLYY